MKTTIHTYKSRPLPYYIVATGFRVYQPRKVRTG